MIESEDSRIAWCSGILEGEGCFSTYVRKRNNVHGVAILCEMTDEDTIQKLKAYLGVGNISYRANDKRSDGRTRKPTWIFSIQKQEDVYKTLLKILPYMSIRRSLKIKEQLSILESKEFYVNYKS